MCACPTTASSDAFSWGLACVSVAIKKNANDGSEHSQRGARWHLQRLERPYCKTRGGGCASVLKQYNAAAKSIAIVAALLGYNLFQSHAYTNQAATRKERGLTQEPGVAPEGHGGLVPKDGRSTGLATGRGRALEAGIGAKTLTVLRAGALIFGMKICFRIVYRIQIHKFFSFSPE